MKALSAISASIIAATCLHLAVPPTAAAAQTAPEASVANLPDDYVIGTQDVLSVVFWRDKEISGDVVVRPDGKISLPLLRDIQAAGYTPTQLADIVQRAAAKYLTEPDATVIVREIRSRKVFVIGEVTRPGAVPLTTKMNVLQLIAEVGGLLEHANKGDIVIVREENGREKRFKFNYNDAVKGKNLEQNIILQPNDTLLVR